MKDGNAIARVKVGLYLILDGVPPELVCEADDMSDAAAIVHAFNEQEAEDPTGGRLLIELCTKSARKS